MKIGLLTYHLACNFGANLQALSTLNYWRNRGHEPIFINWIPDDLAKLYVSNTSVEQMNEHKRFQSEFFPMTKLCRNDTDIVSVVKEEGIEAIIVGSDAVMQTHPIRSRYKFPTRRGIYVYKPSSDTICPNPFWGSFYEILENKIPLCFMSASSQNSPYRSSNRKEKEIQKKLLGNFSYISVRDAWTSKMVEWLTNGECKPLVTPDPVFAFNYNVAKQPTEDDLRRKFGLKKKYYLFSFHSSTPVPMAWLEEMQAKLKERDVECVAFPFPQGIGFHHPFEKVINLPLSPLDWYGLLKYADGYIGENMHPIVICLHNAVPCFSFDNYGITKWHFFVNEKSSKIYHIMNRFMLPENRVSIKGRYKLPHVEDVLKKIDGFDKDNVRKIADSYLEEYKCMMSDIENVINKTI